MELLGLRGPVVSAVRSLAGYRAAETRKERDEFAEQNIPGELIPLWQKTKLNFRGSPEERAEKFLQYAHDHEDESMEATSDAADRKLEAMIREHEAGERAYARRSRSGGFASPNTLLLIGGLAAAAYVVYRVMRKKPAPPPVMHHASGVPMSPAFPWHAPPPPPPPYYAWESAY